MPVESIATATPYIKPAWLAIKTCLKFIPRFWPSIKNYYKRPKLKISVGLKHIMFEDANKTKYNPCFLSVIIENPSDNEFKIDGGSIKINRETYSCCVGSNPIFMRCNEGTKPEAKLTCLDQNSICFFFKTNWQSITQNTAPPLILSAHDKLILPLFLYRNPNFIVDRFAGSILWFPAKKISVRFKINSKDVEYGIKRLPFYETAINWLGFWDNNAST